MAWFLGVYQSQGGRNGGICNCRKIAGTNTWSLHAECRATDLMTEAYPSKWGWQLAEFLRAWSAELGIQCVIYDHKIWSASYPDSGWRTLNSSNPHTDHIHSEVSRHAALTLTVAQINEIARMAKTMRMLPVLKRGSTDKQRVKNLQSLLNSHGLSLVEDGIFGSGTEAKLRLFQTNRKIAVTGTTPQTTWAHLLDVQ
jgi:hypothetical protein